MATQLLSSNFIACSKLKMVRYYYIAITLFVMFAFIVDSGANANPTAIPSSNPTVVPSANPTVIPSALSSSVDIPSAIPSHASTLLPTSLSTTQPSTSLSSTIPTAIPSTPSTIPSTMPTHPTVNSTVSPSASPTVLTTFTPSVVPSLFPTDPSTIPTAPPSAFPSASFTEIPTLNPTVPPTTLPTATPTVFQSSDPSGEPSAHPSVEPTQDFNASPTAIPTSNPTLQQSMTTPPSTVPSGEPTTIPSVAPSVDPTGAPTSVPSTTDESSGEPTVIPSAEPTVIPSAEPTVIPSAEPTAVPSAEPTTVPSAERTAEPSIMPSISTVNSDFPSAAPTTTPTTAPTAVPSGPSAVPTTQPSAQPSTEAPSQPTAEPTAAPSNPTTSPTTTASPSRRPTSQVQTQISFTASQVLDNIAADEFLSNSVNRGIFQNALTQSVSIYPSLNIQIYRVSSGPMTASAISSNTVTTKNQMSESINSNAAAGVDSIGKNTDSFSLRGSATLRLSDGNALKRTSSMDQQDKFRSNQLNNAMIKLEETNPTTLIEYNVVAMVENEGFSSPNAAYTAVSQEISMAVSTGAFTTQLQTLAQRVGSTTLAGSSSDSVDISTGFTTTALRTATPSSAPTIDPLAPTITDDDDEAFGEGLAGWPIYGLILLPIGIIVCTAAIGILWCYLMYLNVIAIEKKTGEVRKKDQTYSKRAKSQSSMKNSSSGLLSISSLFSKAPTSDPDVESDESEDDLIHDVSAHTAAHRAKKINSTAKMLAAEATAKAKAGIGGPQAAKAIVEGRSPDSPPPPAPSPSKSPSRKFFTSPSKLLSRKSLKKEDSTQLPPPSPTGSSSPGMFFGRKSSLKKEDSTQLSPPTPATGSSPGKLSSRKSLKEDSPAQPPSPSKAALAAERGALAAAKAAEMSASFSEKNDTINENPMKKTGTSSNKEKGDASPQKDSSSPVKSSTSPTGSTTSSPGGGKKAKLPPPTSPVPEGMETPIGLIVAHKAQAEGTNSSSLEKETSVKELQDKLRRNSAKGMVRKKIDDQKELEMQHVAAVPDVTFPLLHHQQHAKPLRSGSRISITEEEVESDDSSQSSNDHVSISDVYGDNHDVHINTPEGNPDFSSFFSSPSGDNIYGGIGSASGASHSRSSMFPSNTLSSTSRGGITLSGPGRKASGSEFHVGRMLNPGDRIRLDSDHMMSSDDESSRGNSPPPKTPPPRTDEPAQLHDPTSMFSMDSTPIKRHNSTKKMLNNNGSSPDTSSSGPAHHSTSTGFDF